MASNLEKSILATLVYFDIFDYPLTLVELSKCLLQAKNNKTISLHQLQQTIEESALLAKAVRFKDGFYYLRSKEHVLQKRHNNYITTKRKFENSWDIIQALSYAPFVRGIVASNSMAYQNARKESDIDLVIITKRGGVWIARLFCLLLLKVLQRRPGQQSNNDKICLSMFLDEDHLDLSKSRMGENDIDFTYWVSQFYPLYDSKDYFDKLWKLNSHWVGDRLPQAQQVLVHQYHTEFNKPIFRVIIECLLLPLTGIARYIQTKKFPKSIKSLVNKDTRVQVSKGFLKFHVNDKRIEHLEKFIHNYEQALSNT